MKPIQEIAFGGYLDSHQISSASATLRLCPYSFQLDEDAAPVLCISFEQPEFSEKDMESIHQGEVYSIDQHKDKVEIWYGFGGGSCVLSAKSVQVSWQQYTIDDCKSYISVLLDSGEKTNSETAKLRHLLKEANHFVAEEIKRAEIKRDFSDESKGPYSKQIDLLKRIARKLDAD